MFNEFSLCPGGAFMMCESVSEYDPNASEMQGHDHVEMDHKVMHALNQDPGYDPVIKTINRLEPMYQDMKDLLETELSWSSNEELVGMLDHIRDTATKFANCLRKMIVKANAMYRATSYESWRSESIYNNLGYLIKNRNRLIQQGYDKLHIDSPYLSFFDIYRIAKCLSIFMAANDGLSSEVFDLDYCRSTQYCDYQDVFKDILDMINCLFEDHDRLARLETNNTRDYDINSLINQVSYIDMDKTPDMPVIADCAECNIIKYISMVLRKITQCSDQLQCDAMSGEEMKVDANELVRKLICSTVNIFVISTIYLISHAYDCRLAVNTKRSFDDYVKFVMSKSV